MVERSVEKRITPWLDLVATLVLAPAGSFPVDVFLEELYVTFGVQSSWNWVDPDGSYGFRLWQPIPGWPTEEEMTFFAGPNLDSHPLIRWYRETGDLTPMSLTRVPRPILTQESINLVREHLAAVELDQQLSIPYRASHSQHRVFVLSQTKRDFSDADLALARRLQPLFSLVARQHDVLADSGPDRPNSGGVGAARVVATFGLTARETAVLKLLAEGLTAIAIGRRLGISIRTVHVHLEHVYRKLGVRDRLMAARVAGECGLWMPLKGRDAGDTATASSAREVAFADCSRDVVGQRVAAWIPGAGVVRAGAPC